MHQVFSKTIRYCQESRSIRAKMFKSQFLQNYSNCSDHVLRTSNYSLVCHVLPTTRSTCCFPSSSNFEPAWNLFNILEIKKTVEANRLVRAESIWVHCAGKHSVHYTMVCSILSWSRQLLSSLDGSRSRQPPNSWVLMSLGLDNFGNYYFVQITSNWRADNLWDPLSKWSASRHFLFCALNWRYCSIPP